jgi:hypothetical protein
MSVEPEVFLSYAHADDEGVQYGPRGWVQWFYDAIIPSLRVARGRETRIWLDKTGRINGASVLTPTIKAGLEKSALLITIVSPSYAASRWCEDELKFFRESCAGRGGLSVVTPDGTLARVFMINKRPLEMFPEPRSIPAKPPSLAQIPELADATGYNFYRIVSGKPLEFEPPTAPAVGGAFCEAINNLACDIVRVLDGGKEPLSVPPTGIVVYLAETSSDVAGQREKLRGALRQLGHTMLPQGELKQGSGYADLVRADLSRARISIHVVGATYDVSEQSDRSIVEIQYELAGAEAKRRHEFSRLTWIPPEVDAANTDDRQKAFIQSLEANDPRLVTAPTSLEDFKTLIKDELAKKPEEPPRPSGDAKKVYLIFDAPDRDAADPVSHWLLKQHFTILTPLSKGTAGEIREIHRRNLKYADGVLICYGVVSEFFVKKNLGDLEWIYGAGRSKKRPILARGVYLADPDEACKHDIMDPTVRVIPGFGPFTPEVLRAFMEDLRKGAGAPA